MFYTIEGIDGAGCGVVRRDLERLFKKEKITFSSLKYPIPTLPFGRDIYDYLAGKIEMSPETQFIAFAGQMVLEKKRLKKLRQKVLIVDRYLPCTIVYQGAKGFPIQKGLEFFRLFKMEKPDRIFYLKLPWEIAWQRKKAEPKKSDLHEKDKKLYQKTARIYDRLARQKILAPWVEIDATQTPKEEAQEILEIIKKDLLKWKK